VGLGSDLKTIYWFVKGDVGAESKGGRWCRKCLTIKVRSVKGDVGAESV
jgi:hypothetical protein